MSKYLDHTERIASYLDGDMNPNQMQEFEMQLHTDPVLRSEFELQQDIIHNLQDYRKTQLKARLDQVPVSMGPSGLMGIKAAAAIVMSGIIGLGAYLYFIPKSELPSQISETTITEQVTAPESVITETEVPSDEAEENVDAEEAGNEPVTEPINTILLPTTIERPVTKTETSSSIETTEVEVDEPNPIINTPILISPDLDESDMEETIEVPNAGIAQEGLIDNTVVEIETAKKDSDMFHYQYFSGKLYLYGDFRDYPYEILELNSTYGRRLFIYYNDIYYRILDNQQEITPLEQLVDQDIIQKLEIIQANK